MFYSLGRTARDNKRTKESMIGLNIVREGFLEVAEINLGFFKTLD